MRDALDQFISIEFAITYRVSILELGEFIVQIEPNRCFDATSNPRFDKTADSKRC